LFVTPTSNRKRATRLVLAALGALSVQALYAGIPAALHKPWLRLCRPGSIPLCPAATNRSSSASFRNKPKRNLGAGMAAYMARDYGSANSLLALPAEEGSIQANWMLATMYARGLGVPADIKTAYEIYERMAELYNPEEQDRNTRFFMIDGLSRLADGLRSGIEEADVKRDRRRALRLYRIAASAGHANAQFGLGKMYLGGEGVAKDRSYGMRWLGTAAKKRHSGAAEVLGDIYNEAGDGVRALVWYRVAADTAGSQQSPRVLDKHEQVASTLNQKQLSRADALYKRWTNRFPAQGNTAN
jgi:TPR repeat protein